MPGSAKEPGFGQSPLRNAHDTRADLGMLTVEIVAKIHRAYFAQNICASPNPGSLLLYRTESRYLDNGSATHLRLTEIYISGGLYEL